MELIKEFITTYGNELLYTIITTVLTYVGLRVKTLYEKHVNDSIKKNIIEDTVKYVEQLHSDKSSVEKHDIAKENILNLLTEKKITITDLELEVMIESACNNIKKDKKKDEGQKQ
ncbi:MAG TPA: hypothetical protein IAC02_04055 [Candidatus Coprovivens excrementavium]|nr:hypothetical protein [Candidatus Coprovivens excrementavium]